MVLMSEVRPCITCGHLIYCPNPFMDKGHWLHLEAGERRCEMYATPTEPNASGTTRDSGPVSSGTTETEAQP